MTNPELNAQQPNTVINETQMNDTSRKADRPSITSGKQPLKKKPLPRGSNKPNKKGASIPALIPDWLKLTTMEMRLKAMPEKVAQAVCASHDAGWKNYRGKSETKDLTIVALREALEAGKAIPPTVVKTMLASLRSFSGKALTEGDADALQSLLCEYPHYAVFLYAQYGTDAINERIKRRKGAQDYQSEWTLEREHQAAERCRAIWGGTPPLKELSAYMDDADDPALYGLQSKLATREAIDEFSKKYGLERITRRALDGTWSTAAGQAKLRETYRLVCLQCGRYVGDHELSQRILITLNGQNGAPGQAVFGNTLRARTRKYLKTSVKSLFLDLCASGELPAGWKNQVKTPTTRDGRALGSYSEVWWFEAALEAQTQLDRDHPLKSIHIYNHPYIGSSGRKSDFRVGAVYVEVLRHPLARLAKPIKADEISYAEKFNARVLEYNKQGLEYMTIEPHELASPEKISAHFTRLFSLAGKMPIADISLRVSADKPPGYWFEEQHRDAAILDVIHKTGGVPGRYPSFTEISEHFGGLEAYLHLQGSRLDRQAEALRINTLSIPSGVNRPRRPNEDELLKVCRAHLHSLLDKRGKVTWESLQSTFGRGSKPFFSKMHADVRDYLTRELTRPPT